jgi:hypothetical protein
MDVAFQALAAIGAFSAFLSWLLLSALAHDTQPDHLPATHP